MAEVQRLSAVLRALSKEERKALREYSGSVAVSYYANYALYVHENMQAAHGTDYNERYADEIAAGKRSDRGAGQRAKFLEEPARRLQKQMAEKIRLHIKNGGTLPQAMKKAGLLLQRESQRIVPIDTNNLRSRAKTEIEG